MANANLHRRKHESPAAAAMETSAASLMNEFETESENMPLLSSSKSGTYTSAQQHSRAAPQQPQRRGQHYRGVGHTPVLGMAAPLRNANPAMDLSTDPSSRGCCCIQCIRSDEVGILEQFGEFRELLSPGLVCFIWPCCQISNRLSLRVQQLDITCETKTKDNVFIHVQVAVLFKVVIDKAFEAQYRLSHPPTQIKAHVFDVVRSTIPRLDIDDVFISKSDIALEVQRSLQGMMNQSGYEILETLVTDIVPNALVKQSMNEMNASKRIKQAMPHRAEAGKIEKVKAAEAQAETLYLQGVGVARERQAIVKGMKNSVSDTISETISPKDVMDLLLLSQYMETLTTVGSNSVILHHSPGHVKDLQLQLEGHFQKLSQKDDKKSSSFIPDLLW